jgi:small-conductance mechanosensitive channel|tara:strand:+ start:1592 stop:1981 length:390 start_codon:yes stop_codon:yes gene_type:complete
MWLNLAAKLVPGMIKTGMSIASNRRKVKELQSVAEMRHAEKMASGEIEWKQQQISAQKNDLKDEFVLILISIPLLIAGWGVFSEDEQIIAKLDTFFEQINNFPLWLQGLIVGGYSTVLGIKGVSTFKKK